MMQTEIQELERRIKLKKQLIELTQREVNTLAVKLFKKKIKLNLGIDLIQHNKEDND